VANHHSLIKGWVLYGINIIRFLSKIEIFVTILC